MITSYEATARSQNHTVFFGFGTLGFKKFGRN